MRAFIGCVSSSTNSVARQGVAGALVMITLLMGAACGGGGDDDATPTPDCPTVASAARGERPALQLGYPGRVVTVIFTPGAATTATASPTATPTPCIVGATEATRTTGPGTAPAAVERWFGNGEVSSTVVYPGPNATCNDAWLVEFRFTVDGSGNVSGEGTADLTTPPTCTFGSSVVAASSRKATFRVLGKREGGFNLRFSWVSSEPAGTGFIAGFASMFGLASGPQGGPPISIPVTGSDGAGQGSWQFQSGNPPATYSSSGTITLRKIE